MLPNSSAIDNALIQKLLADSTLMALVPDGIYFGAANPGKQRFVLVSIVHARDSWIFGPVQGRRGAEDILYAVKAVMLSTAGGNIEQAAYRIDQLLEDGTLTVSGYTLTQTIGREERIRETEIDEIDNSIRWLHRGGWYRVMAAPV